LPDRGICADYVELVNHKRVERLYTLQQLQVRRRRRKKIAVSERQPLIRPGAANEVWSVDFVFDRGTNCQISLSAS
jgi:transposase InsO family protein